MVFTNKPVGSQIILYFAGGMLSYMVADLGNASGAVWLPVCNTLVLAAVSPFAGYLQDLFGRRHITLFGSVMIMVGIVLVGTAHTFAQGIVGMCLSGGGAAIGELTALAGYVSVFTLRLWTNNVIAHRNWCRSGSVQCILESSSASSPLLLLTFYIPKSSLQEPHKDGDGACGFLCKLLLTIDQPMNTDIL